VGFENVIIFQGLKEDDNIDTLSFGSSQIQKYCLTKESLVDENLGLRTEVSNLFNGYGFELPYNAKPIPYE
jgi:hypothetical protein